MIVILNENNLNDLYNIEDNCFSHPMSKQNLLDSLTNDKYFVFGYKIDEKIVAYASVFIVSNEAYINNIAVLSEYRKQGIAQKLTNKLIEIAKIDENCDFISLEVRQSNSPAISLYKKLGFEEVANRKNYYSKPTENAIIMNKYFGDNKW